MSGKSTVVDAHQHFWDRSLSEFDHSWQEQSDLAPICRSFLPEDLRPLIEECGVDHTVFVQTQHDLRENDWSLGLADQNSFVCGVVGWVDLTSDACEQQLLQYKDHPAFVGVRHVTQDEPDPDFIVRDDVSAGLSVLEKHQIPFDLLFYSKHLKHAPLVAKRFPELRLVIDHLSKPNIKSGNDEDFKKWQTEIAAAAECGNVFCKLSGLVTEADWDRWSVNDLLPYVETILKEFTPQRIMFGSDWPVCNLAASYSEVFHVAQQCLDRLSQTEREQIFGKTAIEFYQLDV